MRIRSGIRVGGLAASAVLLAGGLAACKKNSAAPTLPSNAADSPLAAAASLDPTLCEGPGKTVLTFDLNRDDKPDVWRLYRSEEQNGVKVDVLTCKQVDFDHDARPDWVVGYTAKGAVYYEKADFDYDGKFDMAASYDLKTGKLTEISRDSDFDGQYDIKEEYDSAGVLTGVQRERDGKKVWEQYRDGQLVAILYDDDGDKVVDRREEAPGARGDAAAPSPEAPPAAEPTPPAAGS